MSRRGTKGVLATGLAAALLCASAGEASAADFFVTSDADDNSDGTLRKEVADAGNGDTVIINPGVNPSLTSGVEITVDADITIRGQGAGATTVDAVSSTFRNRAFNVQGGVTATIENLRITGGQATDGPNGSTPGAFGFSGDVGGGVRNSGALTLDSVRIDGCSAGKGGNGAPGLTGSAPTNGGGGANGGGGGAVFSGGTGLTVIDSTIVGNQSGAGGNGGSGGVDIDVGGLGADGGNGGAGGGGAGIATADALTVINSTIQGNTTGGGGNGGAAGNSPPGPPPAGVGTGGLGGGAGSGGGLSTSSTDATNISNSTITANSGGPGGNGGFGPAAQQQGGNGGFGGGVAGGGTVTITHATIVGNAAGASGAGGASFPGRGGGIHVPAGTTTSRNSILSANTAPATNAGCNGTVVDGGNNLSPAGEGCPAGFGTGNPMLSALANNGGPTQTMAISAAGAADDAVAASGQNCTATDQRGFVRPQGAACDIGAFEITVPALLTVAKTGGGTGTVSGTGISCGADCTETVPFNTVVVLSAVAASGSTFSGWTGCDSPSGATCTQTLGSNETVTATFSLVPVVTPPTTPPVTNPTPAPAAKKCKKGQKLKKGKCVKKKRKKR